MKKHKIFGSAKTYTNKKTKKQMSRIPPSFNWFQSTRNISTVAVDKMKEQLSILNNKQEKSGYEFLLEKDKIPYSLFAEKKPKKKQTYEKDVILDESIFNKQTYTTDKKLEEIRPQQRIKGQSSRIWSELYKVIDASNIILHIVDIRDPLGFLYENILSIAKEKNKQILIILNKCDLVPIDVAKEWVEYFDREFKIPCILFSSLSEKSNYGKTNLLGILRQYKKLLRNRKEERSISVGLVGMPNSGKSSLINILKNKKVCKSAPVAGETKVWQYIQLARNFYLIDSPGVVPAMKNEEAILRGAIRTEKLSADEMERAVYFIFKNKKEQLENQYKVEAGENFEVYIEKLGRRFCMIEKGNKINANNIQKMILNDFLRGQIEHYIRAPVEK